jgi:rare lipoprotein A
MFNKILLIVLTCSTLMGNTNLVLYGQASYYADKYEGRKTASGLIFRQKFAYAAHYSLPFYTTAIVSNCLNGRTAKVVIVDRGPFNVYLYETHGILKPHPTRIIDVSKGTAVLLNMVKSGVVPVVVFATLKGNEI